MNTNLLEETLHKLADAGKKPEDVEWVGSPHHHCSWDEFEKVAKDANYDSGYGSQEVATDLFVVGKDWWLSRAEYDGSERWEFNQKPEKPSAKIELKALTVYQSVADSHSCGYESLSCINGVK